MKKKTQNSQHTLLVVLVVWLLLSSAYIVHDLWKNGLSATYQAGYQKAVTEVISKSQACLPINLFVGETEVNLINLACVEAAIAEAKAAEAANAVIEEDIDETNEVAEETES